MSFHQYNVSQLLKSGIGSTRSYEFQEDTSLDLEDGSARDIAGSVKFTLTNFGILAAVHTTAVLDLTCARCVEPFKTDVDLSFSEEYQPEIDIVTGQPTSGPKNETAFNISRNHTIDLGEAIRQHIILGLEIVPLCRPECRGLCPSCGIDRNMQECSCPDPTLPSPFAVLEGLLTGSESET